MISLRSVYRRMAGTGTIALLLATCLLIGDRSASALAAPSGLKHAQANTRHALSSRVPGTRNLTVPGIPQLYDIVLDEPHGLLYGSDTSGGKIWILSMSNLSTVGNPIDVGQAAKPLGIDLTPDGATLAVARSGFGNIALIDTASRQITPLFPLGATGPMVPSDVRFGRNGRLYSVGNPCSSGFDFVHVFDIATAAEVGRSGVIVRCDPRLAITADGKSLYVLESTIFPNSLTKFDITTDSPTVAASAPFGSVSGVTIAIRPDGSRVYLSSGQVLSGDLQQSLGNFGVTGGHITYSPSTDRVFLTASNQILKGDGTSFNILTSRPTSGTLAGALRVNAAGSLAFVSTDAGFDSISFDTPDAPTGVTAVAGISSATVSWTPPVNTGTSAITGYTIRSSGGATANVGPNVTSTVITGLGPGQRTFTVQASNASGAGAISAPSNAVTVLAGGTYHPLTPARVLDTRDGTGGVPAAPIGPGGVLPVTVAGRGGVPASGVSAVILNVTVTDTTRSSYLTVWPAGLTQPTVSSLNWTPGVTVPNLVEVAVGAGGQLNIFNFQGSVDVIFDVAGWVGDAFNSAGRDGMFNPLQPSRLLDTRNGIGPVGSGGTLNLQVAGSGGVPASGVSAVVLNVTVTNPNASSFLTVWPAGVSQPLASNLNFVAGQTVPNRVVVRLGSGGMISIFNHLGNVDVVVDVNGWYTDATSTTGGSGMVATIPGRFFDSRTFGQPLPGGFFFRLSVQDPRPMTAVVLNVTATNATAPSYLTVWPDGVPLPTASDLNFVAGQTVPNLTVVKLGTNNAFDVFNFQGSVDVVVDFFGFYGGVAPAPPATAAMIRSSGETGAATTAQPAAARARGAPAQSKAVR